MSDLWTTFLDDASVFPPGNLPIADAVPAHRQHHSSAYADVVGPFVVSATDIEELGQHVADWEPESLAISLTTLSPDTVAPALAAADAIAALRVAAIECGTPADDRPYRIVPTLDAAVGDRDIPVFVEVPRGQRRNAVLTALGGGAVDGSTYIAKFRTGGVRAEMYPDETELATAIVGAVRAGVSFKATAGLHHAIRNTDRITRFEQHGFLNVMIATADALAGASPKELVSVLAEREPAKVVARVRQLSPSVRDTFRSVGTCSISEPVSDLTSLGLRSISAAS